jgi:hypothetical protein
MLSEVKCPLGLNGLPKSSVRSAGGAVHPPPLRAAESALLERDGDGAPQLCHVGAHTQTTQRTAAALAAAAVNSVVGETKRSWCADD